MKLRTARHGKCARERTHSQRDLLRQSVQMHNTSVTSGNDVFGVQDSQIRSELLDDLDGSSYRSQHKTRADILVADSAKTYANVVTTQSLFEVFTLFVKDVGDNNFNLEKVQRSTSQSTR